MANVVCVLLTYAFQQCKNFENRLRFDKVTEILNFVFETQCISDANPP